MHASPPQPDALARHFPGLAIPRLALGSFPTPVERLPVSPGGTTLWVKREDLAGTLYGGNKVRKLEYLLAAHRPRPLLTIGASGSHHVLATALYGRVAGCRCYAVMAPQPSSPHVDANRALIEQLLADWVDMPSRLLIPAGMVRLRLRLQRQGLPSPADIPAGGSNPIGCLGWVAGGLEIAEQVRAGLLPEPDQIWLPLGSGGNAAGLLVGLRLAGLSTRVMAVRVVEFPLTSGAAARLLAHRTVALLRAHGVSTPRGFSLGGLEAVNGYLGAGYGHDTPAAIRAIHLAHADLGLELEGTYTAKALAACLDHLRAAPAVRHALFLNTVSSRPLPSPATVPEPR
jgi:1-aminocyclopropane-1-carboxylate deaminase/D-cysteine desulfhydrase-like pyridoxal-dependent ACC family enzyme